MRKLQAVMFVMIIVFSKSTFGQTISPLYIDNDSIDVSNMQFINPANGSKLKSKTEGQLVHINDVLPAIIKMIIPFKNGNQVILETVETKHFYNRCVIMATYVAQNNSKFKECSSIVYHMGDRLIFGKMFCNPASTGMQIDISPYNFHYSELTKGLKIDEKKRWRLFTRNLKKRSSGYQY